MKAKNMLLIGAAALLFGGALLWGQGITSVLSGNATSASACVAASVNDSCASASSSRHGFISSSSSGGTIAVDGTGTVTWASWEPPTETRKLDAAGAVTLAQVKGAARPIARSTLPGPSYMAVAKKIALDSAAIDELRMMAIISDHGFSLYDYTKVDQFLYREALKQGTNVRWVWKPLRETDSKAVQLTSYPRSPITGMGMVWNTLYNKRVPERVLDRVECLLEELPEAIFLVSDYEVVKPDPFLAVTTKKLLEAGRIFIVDQWDEPAFVDKPVLPVQVAAMRQSALGGGK